MRPFLTRQSLHLQGLILPIALLLSLVTPTLAQPAPIANAPLKRHVAEKQANKEDAAHEHHHNSGEHHSESDSVDRTHSEPGTATAADPDHQNQHNVETEMAGEANHHHGSREVSENLPIPQVAMAVTSDSMSGWNLEVQTENFNLTGLQVGEAHIEGQGHIHLYANGVKIARVYGNWYHIPTLPTGDVELQVVLNSNLHETLTHNGEPIAATTTIHVAPSP